MGYWIFSGLGWVVTVEFGAKLDGLGWRLWVGLREVCFLRLDVLGGECLLGFCVDGLWWGVQCWELVWGDFGCSWVEDFA